MGIPERDKQGGLDQGSGNGGEETRLQSDHIMKVELAGITDD